MSKRIPIYDRRRSVEEQIILTPKRVYRRLGLALFVTALSTVVLQLLIGFIAGVLAAQGSDLTAYPGSNLTALPWFSWVVSFVPLYLIGIPLGLLILRSVPAAPCETMKLGGKNFFLFLLMCFPMMYGGNLVGTLLSTLLSGGRAENALNRYIFDDSPLKILVIVVLAPILEEFLFRKQLIDRCSRYGEKNAILFSALMFGLFHMNLYQFFYAFGMGLVFAYVYTRTRRLRYSILMHMVINSMGAVLAPLLLSLVDLDGITQMASGELDPEALLHLLPALGALLGYALVLLGLSVAGLVVLIVKAPKLIFRPSAEELPKGQRFRTIYCNGWVIAFALFCAAVCGFSLLG
jgi:membrane protease YdiL (CAAX protease family)